MIFCIIKIITLYRMILIFTNKTTESLELIRIAAGFVFVWFIIKCREDARWSSTSVKNVQDRNVNRASVFRNFIQIGHVFDSHDVVFPHYHVTWIVCGLSVICGRRVHAYSIDLSLVYQPRDRVFVPAWEMKRGNIGGRACPKHEGLVWVSAWPTGIHHDYGMSRHFSVLLLPRQQVSDQYPEKKVELKNDLLIPFNGFEEVIRFSFLLKG